MTTDPDHYPQRPPAVSERMMLSFAAAVLTVLLIPEGRVLSAATSDPGAGVEQQESSVQSPDPQVQEEIGNRILALDRYDSERLTQLAERWRRVSDDAISFADSRNARLQEALGLSIATTAQLLYNDRASLDAALADALDLQQRVRSGAWLQERLGEVILQTAAFAAPNTARFQEQLQSRIKVLSEMERRMALNTDARVVALSARQAQLPREAIARLADAVADGHRVARFYDASVDARIAREMDAIRNEMAQTRSAEDYQQLAEAAEAAIRSPWNTRGFLEFGAAALLGAIAMMAWVGLFARGGLPRARTRDIKPIGWRASPPLRWRDKVARTQSTTLSIWPHEVMFGSHCTRDIGRYVAREKAAHVTIVTDQGVAQQGLVDPVKASLTKAGVTCDVVDQVSREVPHTVIAEIASRCQKSGTDWLVAVGGGSVIDTAKAVGIVLANGGSIQDYEGVDRISRPITPLYAVPTTAGSGAETSPFCIVRDTAQKRKIEIFSRKLIPQRIFIDPLMTRSMPPELTASSGMDALANAIEAYFSTFANPVSDTLALDAIRLIAENLRAAVANGNNLKARQQMALAAFEAGHAAVNARSGAVHALGHSLSGLFDIPERIGDAILLPHVMKANMNADIRRMAKVAEALGESVEGLSVRAAAQRAINAVMLLMVDVGLPTSLTQVGVDKSAIATLSERALQDPFLATNPRAFSRKDIAAIYEDAFIEYAEVEMESTPSQGTSATVP
ncbi:MAG: iron-containing alcohol dehydrogenase [Nitrospirota bacterium]